MSGKVSSTLISVILPTLNRSRTLSRAISSVLNQTHQNFELIIIDNCSTDSTDDLVRQISDNRLIYLKNPIRHLSVSRNIGIRRSNGEYIALLDSDDWWTCDKLELSVNELLKGFDFVYHDLYKYYSLKSFNNLLTLNDKLKTRQLKSPVFNDLFFNSNAINVSSVVFSKSLFFSVDGFLEIDELRNCEDYDCWLRMSLQSQRFSRINKCLGYYEIASDTMKNDNLRIKAFKYILEKYDDKYNYPKYPLPSHFFSSLAISYFRLNFFSDSKYWAFRCLNGKGKIIPKVKSLLVLFMVYVLQARNYLLKLRS